MKRNYLSGNQKKKKKREEEQKRKQDTGALLKFLHPALPSVVSGATEGPSTSSSSHVYEEEQVEDNIAASTPLPSSGSTEVPSTPSRLEEEQVEASTPLPSSGSTEVPSTPSPLHEEDKEEDDIDMAETTPPSRTGVPVGIASTTLSDDPGCWPSVLTSSMRCEIVKKGPVQIMDIEFPQNLDNPPRRFTKDSYKRTMKNGENIHRSWLVYSIHTDGVFCFPCTVFGKRERDNALTTCGYGGWKNLSYRLKKHECTKVHCDNVKKWHDLQRRLQTSTLIDQRQMELMQLEVEHWKGVIRRVIAIVSHLAERNQALRGTTSTVYDRHNGNFLAQVELLAQFDPVMNEHIRRIQCKETKVHYLSGVIQNEIIQLVGDKILQEIARRVHKAKYFSVIMDCTPDISHKEQLSVVLRIVNCETPVSIAEHFLGFVHVEDTTGKGLSEILLDQLEKHNLSISDCRGQSYDNGSNMMGHKQGVQARILELNNKALCIPCSSHTLNLVVSDAAKSSVLSMSFFGMLQRLYNLFSSSVHRWAILKQHVKQLTLKPLSGTRWEARIDSVKVVRYHLPEILDGLSALETYATEKGDSETMSSAKSLHGELKTWSFLLCTITWYNVLYQVNHMSKLLQSPDVSMQTLKKETEGVTEYLEDFRENGLASSQTDAMEIAEDLEIERKLPEKRQRKKKRQFLYESTDETQSTPEEAFRRDFFLPLVDTAITSLKDRFSRLEGVYALYDFLFSIDIMRATIKTGKLHERCRKVEQTLHDIDADDLALEINSAVHTFPDEVSRCPFKMLDYIYSEKLLDLYSNLSIALRLLLTLPVSVASGERSFSSLKRIKNYMRSTMSQERLSGLALMSIESDVRRSLDLEGIVSAFAEAKGRKQQFQ
ncbi:zinc finger MYM-type protein 1-like isoform X2 [Eleginops maclovinus]|uniref:zinc finger MYM-type protein 1-like isoform X2 n=1 Tax=Eleginops maclovinus TaxID=56733 RepID=UPI003080D162